MKPYNYLLVSVAVVAMLIAFAPAVQAGYIFSYDWDNGIIQASDVIGSYSTGQGAGGPGGGGMNVNGQDGWERVPGYTAAQTLGNPRVSQMDLATRAIHCTSTMTARTG